MMALFDLISGNNVANACLRFLYALQRALPITRLLTGLISRITTRTLISSMEKLPTVRTFF